MFINYQNMLCFIFALTTISLNCSERSEYNRSYEDLQFEIERELMGNSFTDSTFRLTFYPPKGWNMISQKITGQLEQKISNNAKDTSLINICPIQLFFNQNKQCLCVISEFKKTPMNCEFAIYIKNIKEFISNSNSKNIIKQGFFKLNKLRIFQLLVLDNKNINLKLICKSPESKPFVLDYIVPRMVYPDVLKSIETSIGSMTVF